jgi:cell division protein FtsL
VSYNRPLTFAVKAKDQVVVPQREEIGRSEPRARIRAWVLGTAIALIALAVGSVFGDRGILNLVNKRRQVDALRAELEGLRSENARLTAEIASLRTSPRAIERLAREQLGLARPDETVFLIREEDRAGRP